MRIFLIFLISIITNTTFAQTYTEYQIDNKRDSWEESINRIDLALKVCPNVFSLKKKQKRTYEKNRETFLSILYYREKQKLDIVDAIKWVVAHKEKQIEEHRPYIETIKAKNCDTYRVRKLQEPMTVFTDKALYEIEPRSKRPEELETFDNIMLHLAWAKACPARFNLTDIEKIKTEGLKLAALKLPPKPLMKWRPDWDAEQRLMFLTMRADFIDFHQRASIKEMNCPENMVGQARAQLKSILK